MAYATTRYEVSTVDPALVYYIIRRKYVLHLSSIVYEMVHSVTLHKTYNNKYMHIVCPAEYTYLAYDIANYILCSGEYCNIHAYLYRISALT